MAETKYDLQLVHTSKDTKIYNQPWYKERLQTKYIKSLGPNDTSAFLHGKNWSFIKDGLDDFRDGLPPPVAEEKVMLKGHKGLQPIIQGSNSDISSVKQPAARHRFNKHEVCFSRATPLQQQRRDHIDEIEFGLTQHPLALYPHLEECLPPDVFEDVVDILDPEMNLADEDEEAEDEFLESESDAMSSHRGGRVGEASEAGDKESEDGKVRNPYRWLPRKDEKEKQNRKKAAEKRASSPSQDKHINDVTKEFCDWVASLGGDTNNIEESTITSLFASGYETKPALSVPIHVVELTNVPPELRMSAQVPKQQDKKDEKTKAKQKPADWGHTGQYEPSWVKFRYGAWYLPAKTWKPMKIDEPLEDPKALKEKEESEAKKKSNALDTELAPMHGAKAFMEFIDHKIADQQKTDSSRKPDQKGDSGRVRRPEFLTRVAAVQEQQAKEEAAKQEAELLKQRKLTSRRAAPDS